MVEKVKEEDVWQLVCLQRGRGLCSFTTERLAKAQVARLSLYRYTHHRHKYRMG